MSPAASRSEPVRIGVWGVGAWGERHARVLAALPEAELIGVYDRDPARAAEVAARYGTRALPSPEAMLEACDAVTIATATVAHRAAAERAAAFGRHALVEKPMAATVEEAEAMRAAADRAGTMLQVGHVERFNPALIAARPHIRRPKFVEAHRLALFQPRSLDIDVVFDLMIHDIDIVLAAADAVPTEVSAVGVAVLSGNEDIANARLEFEDGCVANLTASRVSQDRLRRIRFFQDDSYLSVDLFESKVDLLQVDTARLGQLRGADAKALREAGPGALAAAAIRRGKVEVGEGEPLALELQAFVRSLRGLGAGAAPAEAGFHALRVAERVQAEMKRRTRRWTTRPSVVS
jgi:predicted dehydrogenase